MPRLRCYILLMLCLLLPAAAMAQAGGKALFELQKGTDGGYHLEFRIENIALLQGQDGYITLQADDMQCLAPSEGMPALPQSSRLLALPRGTELHIERLQEGNVEMLHLPDGKVLAPWQGAAVKDAEPTAAEPDKAAYATDSLIRWGDPIEVENLGAMGDRQLFRIIVRPMAYNPIAKEMAVSHYISATLTTTNSSPLTPHPSLLTNLGGVR